MSTLIKNGNLVSTEGIYRADLRMTNGVISEIGRNLAHGGEEIVDAEGMLVLPGAIDAHTHLAMEFGGTVSSDDYETGTRAAACGGTTTVFDFAMQDKGELFTDTLRRRAAMCEGNACVDYSFHVGVKDISGDILSSIAPCVAMGVTSFKAFMVYDFGLADGALYALLLEADKRGALMQVHAENRDMVNYLTRLFLDEGETDAWHHYLSRPELVEGEAVHRAIALARLAGARLYIVHLSGDEGIKAVRRAKREGLPVWAETCPQYLEFTNEVYRRSDGRNFVCSPPMKGPSSRKELWSALSDGTIDVIATDHCPFTQAEKDWGLNDFSRIPNGCAGIENMYPYMLSAAGCGKLSYERAVYLCSTNVARVFGCQDKKGSLTVGKDADVVLYDPSREITIRSGDMHSSCDHTIWEGVKMRGYPVRTYCRGRLVYDEGAFVGERGYGKFVKCAPMATR